MRYHNTYEQGCDFKKEKQQTNVGKDMENSWWDCKMVHPLWKSLAVKC
jgi:hypothetical protein